MKEEISDREFDKMIADKRAEIESEPLQLMLWEEQHAVMPRQFIASSVFSAMQSQDTPHFENLTLIAEWDGYQLRYKGRQLTQLHADVWLAVLDLAQLRGPPKAQTEGTRITFRARQLLRIMRYKDFGTKTRALLHEWISDLASCVVQVILPGGKAGYFNPLLPETKWVELPTGKVSEDGKGEIQYTMTLDHAICAAFTEGHVVVRWEERRRLGGRSRNELALWLLEYMRGFPLPIAIGDLKVRSHAPKSQRLADFRRKAKLALTLLQKTGAFKSWSIDAEDRVHVKAPEQLK